MAVLNAYSHKRGDSFSMASQWPLQADETPTDLTGWTGRAQVRTEKDQLVSELDFAWVDQAQGMFIVEDLDTEDWPIGKVLMDVEMVNTTTEFIMSSPTLTFTIVRDVTHD